MNASLAAIFAVAATALQSTPSPFAPAATPAPKIVRLLAPSGTLDARTLGDFERESGYAVAYDAYGDAARILPMMNEGPYDVIVLPGPVLARAIAAGELRRLDKALISNARLVEAPVTAKLAAYDPGGVYSLPWGWSATGLLYDAGKTARLLGGPPVSWAAALAPAVAGKLAPCGVALPDARDQMFIAAWRLLGIDPGRLRERDVRAAADLIIRARKTVRLPASRDPIAAIAGGAVCLTFGDAAQAGIASLRSREGGEGSDIRHIQPREGGPLAIDALAEPRDAPHPEEALALIDFLLRPAVAAKAAEAGGLASAEAGAAAESFRFLWPVGAYDPRLEPVVEREWARVRAPEQPQGKSAARPANAAASKPASASAAKPAPAKRRRR